jgi:hypothetical protein
MFLVAGTFMAQVISTLLPFLLFVAVVAVGAVGAVLLHKEDVGYISGSNGKEMYSWDENDSKKKKKSHHFEPDNIQQTDAFC